VVTGESLVTHWRRPRFDSAGTSIFSTQCFFQFVLNITWSLLIDKKTKTKYVRWTTAVVSHLAWLHVVPSSNPDPCHLVLTFFTNNLDHFEVLKLWWNENVMGDEVKLWWLMIRHRSKVDLWRFLVSICDDICCYCHRNVAVLVVSGTHWYSMMKFHISSQIC
jgi:hypothetical protein